MSKDSGKVTRRTIIGGAVVAVTTAGFGLEVRAQGTLPREQVMYVEKTQTPGRFCANCLQWKGTPVADYAELDESNPEMAACAIVAGEVASTGWCGVWAPRG